MSPTDTTLWAIALALGAVVIVVTAWLLNRFSRQVRHIGNSVNAAWNAGTSVARNTASTWMLRETADRLDALIDEAGEHRQVLRPDAAGGPR